MGHAGTIRVKTIVSLMLIVIGVRSVRVRCILGGRIVVWLLVLVLIRVMRVSVVRSVILRVIMMLRAGIAIIVVS